MQSGYIQSKSSHVTQDLQDAVNTACPEQSETAKAVCLANDQIALAIIELLIKPGKLIHIKKYTSAGGACDAWEAIHKAENGSRIVT